MRAVVLGACLFGLLLSSSLHAMTCGEHLLLAQKFFAAGFMNAHKRTHARDFQTMGSEIQSLWVDTNTVEQKDLDALDVVWNAKSTAALSVVNDNGPFKSDLQTGYLMRLLDDALEEQKGEKLVMAGAVGIGQVMDLFQQQLNDFDRSRANYALSAGAAGFLFTPIVWIGAGGNEFFRRYWKQHVEWQNWITAVRKALLLDKSKVTEPTVLGVAARVGTQWSLHLFLQTPNEEPKLLVYYRPADEVERWSLSGLGAATMKRIPWRRPPAPPSELPPTLPPDLDARQTGPGE